MRVHLSRLRRPTDRPRDERGGVAVVVAALIIPFCLITAFTLDVGMTYAQAQAFSSGADSAALAIARAKQDALNKNPTMYTSCQSLKNADGGQALAIARRQADANRPYELTSSGATPDVQVDVQMACVDEDGLPKADGVLTISVTVQRDVPTTLGRLAGVSSIKAMKTAKAGLGGSTTAGGVFPLAICDQVADAIQDAAKSGPPYANTVIETDKVWHPGCASSGGNGNGNGKGKGNGNGGPGNWGWLSCSKNGAKGLGDAIKDGCDIDFTLTGTPPTLTLGGEPGNKINAGPVKSAIEDVLGNTYAFPVYDEVSGQGNNTDYRVIGFMELKLVSLDNGEITVQYVSYSPVGEFDPTCGIGSSACSTYNSWATDLLN